MTDLKGKIDNAKDKIVGEVKEAVGKVTGNEELELKGKIQSAKPDLGDKVDEIKQGIAGKINDLIDKKKENVEDK
ncbi:MAG: CsbD family protein [Firmicutes bacterium]|nr:CsbD family protein [Bacillota bacterium]